MYHSMIQYTACKEFQLLLFITIDKVWDYINQPASNPLLYYNDGSYIFDIPSFNKEVIGEAILNVCCHRSMLIQSDVVIKQYLDSITITNAGGFPSGVDMNNILTVNSVPRSKLMSRRQDWWSVPVKEWKKCSTTVLWKGKHCLTIREQTRIR